MSSLVNMQMFIIILIINSASVPTVAVCFIHRLSLPQHFISLCHLQKFLTLLSHPLIRPNYLTSI
eukprot:UN01384